jgi:hypothetical protein
VVERVKVLHRELLLESCSGILEKLWARGGEDDVVDVEQQVSNVSEVFDLASTKPREAK